MQFFSLSLSNVYAQLDLTVVGGENVDNAGKMVFTHMIFINIKVIKCF